MKSIQIRITCINFVFTFNWFLYVNQSLCTEVFFLHSQQFCSEQTCKSVLNKYITFYLRLSIPPQILELVDTASHFTSKMNARLDSVSRTSYSSIKDVDDVIIARIWSVNEFAPALL